MLPLARPPLPPGTDPRLRSFLEASVDADADRALTQLMDSAAPIFAALLRRKMRDAHGADAQDVASEARTQLAAHLLRLRADPCAHAPIADFPAYVATVIFTAWAADLRRRNPGRALLLNRLRYLLENRTNQHGFALWTGPGGEPLAGFAAWRDRPSAPVPARHQCLRADPRAAADAACGAGRGDERSSSGLAKQVAGLLSWLGGPVPLRELTDALADLTHAAAPAEPLPVEDGTVAEWSAPADPQPSPHDALRWKEYLSWLWRETARLTLRQRTAFLLHSNCLRETELLGLTSVRQAAALLEMPPARMAEYWNILPLEDRAIAAWLGVESQQVINLRKVARGILGRAWRKWLDEK